MRWANSADTHALSVAHHSLVGLGERSQVVAERLRSMPKMGADAPIAIFDSGLGGLTVVRAIRKHLPHEHVVYFGDTARVPYGIKSAETVTRFAAEDCQFLLRFAPKLIVVACNTASAAALPALREWLSIPVIGVVNPGAKAAAEAARGRTVLVLGTEGTVRSQAYVHAIAHVDPRVKVVQRACPLIVPCVEEGRTSYDRIVQEALKDYLAPTLALNPELAAAVLGCTHYPMVREAIAAIVGPSVSIVCSAEETARAVVAELASTHRMRAAEVHRPAGTLGKLECFVSDNPERFAELGSRFLGERLDHVEWVSPEQFMLADSPLSPRLAVAG